MNFKIKYFSDYSFIESSWQAVFHDDLPSFCSPAWHAVVLELYNKARLDTRLTRIRYFQAERGKDRVLGFFFENRFGKQKELQFAQGYGSSDYYDWVYPNSVTVADLEQIIRQIANEYKGVSLIFRHVQASSKLCVALQNIQAPFSELVCVAIDFEEDYEQHIKSLRKSVRQNLRTANNRVKRDELEMEFKMSEKGDAIDFDKLKSLYKQRNAHKNNAVYWKTKVLHYLNYGKNEVPDMFGVDAIKQTDFCLAELFLNGTLAAYFFGYRQGAKIEINRVVINDDFRFYSPGLLLLAAYMENEIPNGLKVLDLTVGDEKYKYDLGGKDHLIYNFKIER